MRAGEEPVIQCISMQPWVTAVPQVSAKWVWIFSFFSPLHLTLISLWWHFISLPSALLSGEATRSKEKTVLFVPLVPVEHKKMEIQINETKHLFSPNV